MIVVVGAGIAGLSLAHALAKRGAAVSVLEANTVASGASGVATSYLEPRLGQTPMRKIEWEALRRWPEFAAELETDSGINVEFRTEGQVRVVRAENLEKFETDLRARKAQNWAFERLSTQQVLEREPSLSKDIVAGTYLPNVRWVTGRLVCQALVASIRKLGGTVFEGMGVESLTVNGEGVEVMMSKGNPIRCDKIVLCNGMGASEIAGIPEDVPASRPVRGVNLVFDQSKLAHPVTHLIKHHRGNFCPRSNGELIVGTTYEPGIDVLDAEEPVIEMLYANAEPIFPDLRDLPLLRVTAGLRTKVGDGNLRLGRSAELPNVYYSLSHAGAGFLRAPVVADEFSNFILNDIDGAFTGIATSK